MSVCTFDKAVGSLEAPGDRVDAATDERHCDAVIVAHKHRRTQAAAEHADVSRLTTNVDRHGHRVDVVTPFTAQTTYSID